MSRALISNQRLIIRQNKKDLVKAKGIKYTAAFIDRLSLTRARIKAMSESIKALINLPDPVGEIIKQWRSPGGGLWKPGQLSRKEPQIYLKLRREPGRLLYWN